MQMLLAQQPDIFLFNEGREAFDKAKGKTVVVIIANLNNKKIRYSGMAEERNVVEVFV